MSVNPGFGWTAIYKEFHQQGNTSREMLARHNSSALMGVDGGINLHAGAELAKSGADILVAGSYIFNSSGPHNAIHSLACSKITALTGAHPYSDFDADPIVVRP